MNAEKSLVDSSKDVLVLLKPPSERIRWSTSFSVEDN